MFETAVSDPTWEAMALLQQYGAVLHLFAYLRILVEIANAATSRGRQVFEFRQRITKLSPRVRVKFTHYACAARKNLLRTFQNTDFRSLRIDFHATEFWEVALR